MAGQNHDRMQDLTRNAAQEKDAVVEHTYPSANFAESTPEASIGAPLEIAVSTASDPYGSRPKCFKNLLSECLFVLTTSFAIGQTAMLMGALTVMSASIQQGLDMNSSEVTWLIAGMSLTSGATLLFFGKVADLFGRRLLLICSMAAFTVFLLITSFAQNAIMAEIFLALAGIACASVVPPAIGKLGAIYEKPSRRKNRAFACFSGGNPVGFVIGAIVGGVASDLASWRVPLWVITVIYGVLTIVAYFTTPSDAEQSLGGFNMETAKQLDWLGAFLAIAGIALFTAAFTLAPDAGEGWATGYVIAMLVVGVVLITAFLYWQSICKHALMPLRVWRDKNFSLLVASLCLGYYGFSGNFFWMALGWQRSYRNSPLEVAIKLLPAAIGGILVNVLAALVMHRISNKTLSIFAATCTLAASALLSASSKTITYWALYFPAQLLSVLGADFAFCVTNLYVMSSLPPDKQSVAGGMFQTTTRLAGTIGLGVSTTVFASAGGSTAVSTNVPWTPYRATFWVSLVGAVVGLGLTFFLTIGKQGHRQLEKKTPVHPSQETGFANGKQEVEV